jgi:hypothetical protein
MRRAMHTKKTGHVLGEYTTVLSLVLMVLGAMQTFVIRGMNARYKAAGDYMVERIRRTQLDIGEHPEAVYQYEPPYFESKTTTDVKNTGVDSYDSTSGQRVAALDMRSSRTGYQMELPPLLHGEKIDYSDASPDLVDQRFHEDFGSPTGILGVIERFIDWAKGAWDFVWNAGKGIYETISGLLDRVF